VVLQSTVRTQGAGSSSHSVEVGLYPGGMLRSELGESGPLVASEYRLRGAYLRGSVVPY